MSSYKKKQHIKTFIRRTNKWKKTRGRPRAMWIDNITEWTQMQYIEAVRAPKIEADGELPCPLTL